jgi:hypothetical protein
MVRTATLILITFFTTFYSRIFCTLTRLPSALGFLHFAVALVTFGVAISTTHTKNRNQISITYALLAAVFILLLSMSISGAVNKAGLINVVFNFLILGEPFLLIIAFICLPLSLDRLQQIRYWVIVSAVVNFLLAEAQSFLLKIGRMGMVASYTLEDQVQGTFYLSGAGGYISSAVSVSVALYYITYAKSAPIWLKALAVVATIHHILISDTKQVLIVGLLAWILLGLSKFQDIKQLLIYGVSITFGLYAFIWAARNIEAFALFGNFMERTDMYEGPNGGPVLKMEGIRMVISYYQSPLNWLFGLGPGHTLGRLGGWTIHDYWSLLSPLGATAHPIYDRIWSLINGSWILMASTFFVPLFSWAGIWGDLGFVGLGSYLYLSYLTWRYLCVDDFCKYLMLVTLIYGFFLTQMEEPGYMLSVAMLIGLRWHEHRIQAVYQPNLLAMT